MPDVIDVRKFLSSHSSLPVRGSKTSTWPHWDLWKRQQKLKLWLCFDYGHQKSNWMPNLYPLPPLSTSYAYFEINRFWCFWEQWTYTIPIKMVWAVVLSSFKTHFYHKQTKIQIFKFLHFLKVCIGYVNSSEPPYRKVPVDWFQNLYHPWYVWINHPSFCKSEEINSCKLSPLPSSCVRILPLFLLLESKVNKIYR